MLCYRCKTRHMLGENCPVAIPTIEDFNMCVIDQSDIGQENLTSVQPQCSAEIPPSGKPQQNSSLLAEVAGGENSSAEETS